MIFVRAPAASAHEANAVGIVHHDQGAVFGGQIADGGEIGDVAVHGENAVGGDHAGAGGGASRSLASRSAMSLFL